MTLSISKSCYKVIIEALEKQMPKKPALEADGYYNGELVFDTWYCPNCNKSYDLEYDCDRLSFCSNCGQAIDWTEDE